MEHDIWAEKYRPQTLQDLVIPARIRNELEGYLSRDVIPHMLFAGRSGIGKTTAALAFIHDADVEFIKINGSLTGIDTLRHDISNFVSTVSYNGKKKVVLFDEMDGLNVTTFQPALRGFADEYAEVAAFIGTANFPAKVMGALGSRVSVIDFDLQDEEKREVAKGYFARLKVILAAEGVPFEEKAVAALVGREFPDFRQTIVQAQKIYNTYGEISEDALHVESSESKLPELVKMIKEKDYKSIRDWVGRNSNVPYSQLYSAFYHHAYTYVAKTTIPQFVIILAKYLDQHSRSTDHEITMAACMAEIMQNITWL